MYLEGWIKITKIYYQTLIKRIFSRNQKLHKMAGENKNIIDDSFAKPSPAKSDKMPSAIPYIIGNEAAERFNYYGLRAILVTFMVAQFYNPTHSEDQAIVQAAEATANAKTHDFVAMSYLLPLFGGMMADWFWGKYKTILYLSIVYAIGNLMLALSVNNETVFTSALMLIALGAGGIKPCVSANVGDQFGESNQHLMSQAFSYFYAAINAGSLLSILMIPYLKAHYGAQVAFGVPAIAMIIATLFFYAGRDKYVRVPPKGDSNKTVIFITAFGSLVISYLVFDKFGTYFFGEKYQGGTGPILGAWGLMILVVALIFNKQWFAKPGNFIGINLYKLTNGGTNYSSLLVAGLGLPLAYISYNLSALFPKVTSVLDRNMLDIIESKWSALFIVSLVIAFLISYLKKNQTKSTELAISQYGADKIAGIQSVWRIFAVFAFVPIFWALWDQSQSEWVVQAGKMDLHWFGIDWQAEQISFVNAGFILAFIPLFNFVVFPLIEKMGIKVTPLRKLGAGFVLTALSFVIIALIQTKIDVIEAQCAANGTMYKDLAAAMKPNISLQIFAFIILTAGEVLVSITCLEYAYTQAPPSMKSTIMASYLLTVTIGNVLVSVIQNNIKSGGFFAKYHGADFFWLFTAICVVNAIIFMCVSPFIKEKSYVGVGVE
jgi:dipeptide/tripeptide permease